MFVTLQVEATQAKEAKEVQPEQAQAEKQPMRKARPESLVMFSEVREKKPRSYPAAEFDAKFGAYRGFLETRARRRVGREDAEDLVGRCYHEARKSLAYYHSERGLAAWLIGILDNLLGAHFRHMAVQREDRCADATLLADGPDLQTAHNAREESNRETQRRQLYALIGAVDLTARQYECLLRTLHGETQQQIADSLHISQRMAGYHLQAAVQHLADHHKANEKNREEDDFTDAFDCFCQCAHQNIYHKPHSFDNQSTSEERERRRYACLREVVKDLK